MNEAQRVTERLSGIWNSQTGKGRARCPAHNGKRESLSIWTADNGELRLKCHTGCSRDKVKSAIGRYSPSSSNKVERPTSPIKIKSYRYRDEHGELRYEVVRYRPKDFRQRRPDRHGGYIWNMHGVDPLPYRLPRLLKYPDRKVYIVEGEKDVDSLTSLKVVATCNHGGAGKWSPEISHYLDGRDVVILPDNDDAGHKHALDVAEKLTGIAASIKIVELPDLPEKGDVTDWIKAGGTKKALFKLVKSAPEHEPQSLSELPAPAAWPVLHDDALIGLAGKVVKKIDRYTEADRAATLISFLVAFGNCMGRKTYFRVARDFHYTNLYTVLVGETAKSRKGTSWNPIKDIFKSVDADWVENQIASGLSTGEGLIHRVRDEEEDKKEGEAGQLKGKGAAKEKQKPKDKRLLVNEPEFASVLRRNEREGSSLSETMRLMWDGSTLQTLTKADPMRATGVHGSIIAHITLEELKRRLNRVEIADGYANRFLFICVRRSKKLPFGKIDDSDLAALARKVKAAIEKVAEGELGFDRHAAAYWAQIYDSMADAKPGLLGSLLARAEPQIRRLALVYACLDGQIRVYLEHLKAAIAVWTYVEQSARYIFGSSLGDAVADRVLEELREAGALGLSKNELGERYGKHPDQAAKLNQALELLTRSKLMAQEVRKTGGRPKIVYRAVRP